MLLPLLLLLLLLLMLLLNLLFARGACEGPGRGVRHGRIAARRREEDERPFIQLTQRRLQHVRAHDHPGAAAAGRVVHLAVPPDAVLAPPVMPNSELLPPTEPDSVPSLPSRVSGASAILLVIIRRLLGIRTHDLTLPYVTAR